MPNFTSVNAAPEQVIGVTQAVRELRTYDHHVAEAAPEKVGESLGHDFMRAAGRIIQNLVDYDGTPKKPKTRNDLPYENNHGMQFRRVTEHLKNQKPKLIRNYVRFILPETSTSEFRVVHLDYKRTEFDALNNPTQVADADSTLNMEFFRHPSIHHPDATFAYEVEKGEASLRDNKLGGGYVKPAEQGANPGIAATVDDMVNTIQILETASERDFTRVPGHPNILLTGGFHDIRASRHDPYDLTSTKGQIILDALVASQLGRFAYTVWNGESPQQK